MGQFVGAEAEATFKHVYFNIFDLFCRKLSKVVESVGVRLGVKMSMLAEPRRKQRIGPNPRGKFFTEDEDNKGRIMLQKLGWKSGDGLGAGRNGIIEPIKPKIQSDAKGLGFDVKSDPWVEHSDGFNAILKSLQSTYGPKDEVPPTTTLDDIFGPAPTGFGFKAEEPPKKVKKHEELEAKSKSSRSRIHYHKFTKNKDLSKIGEKDWSCIFGKPIDDGGNPVEVKPELVAPNREEMDDEEETSAHNVYGSAKYINRGSLTDYFKSQRDKAFQKSTLPEDEKQEEIELPVEKVEIETIAEDAEDESSSRKHKKKSKKSKKRNQVEVEAEEEDSPERKERKESKKDKKKKRKELEESTTEYSTTQAEESIENEAESEHPVKKKKSKRDKTQADDVKVEMQVPNFDVTGEIEPEQGSVGSGSDNPVKKNKKRKKETTPDIVVEQQEESVESDEPVKKKKSKKEKMPEPDTAEEVETAEEQVANVESESHEPIKKKKKPKKEKTPEAESAEAGDAGEQEEKLESDEPVKKNKSKKDKKNADVELQVVPNSDEDKIKLEEESVGSDDPVKKKKKSKKEKTPDTTDTTKEQEELATEESISVPTVAEEEPEKFINCGSMVDYFKKLQEKTNKTLPVVPVPVPEELTNDQETVKEEDGPDRLKEQQDNLNGRKTPKRNQITASERQEAALTFKGSNILTIPGYRNQSNKL